MLDERSRTPRTVVVVLRCGRPLVPDTCLVARRTRVRRGKPWSRRPPGPTREPAGEHARPAITPLQGGSLEFEESYPVLQTSNSSSNKPLHGMTNEPAVRVAAAATMSLLPIGHSPEGVRAARVCHWCVDGCQPCETAMTSSLHASTAPCPPNGAPDRQVESGTDGSGSPLVTITGSPSGCPVRGM